MEVGHFFWLLPRANILFFLLAREIQLGVATIHPQPIYAVLENVQQERSVLVMGNGMLQRGSKAVEANIFTKCSGPTRAHHSSRSEDLRTSHSSNL